MNCENTAIVYTKPGCPDCVLAKKLLESKNYCIEEKVIGQDATVQELFDHIGSPVRTMPQIFVVSNDEESYVGGYQALIKHFQ